MRPSHYWSKIPRLFPGHLILKHQIWQHSTPRRGWWSTQFTTWLWERYADMILAAAYWSMAATKNTIFRSSTTTRYNLHFNFCSWCVHCALTQVPHCIVLQHSVCTPFLRHIWKWEWELLGTKSGRQVTFFYGAYCWWIFWKFEYVNRMNHDSKEAAHCRTNVLVVSEVFLPQPPVS